ncbi:DUF1049 domain-containing protein [Brachybacterium sp. EF45031]|uniref:LapA family protein n=1 Tax=Brachybacterium sillae TaxID=2810536 RepID=UPI00217ED1A1|nr:lipopolysaccharide assembly protein LapA domain-containing protein [Brachybacterium sillae]MCS6711416.1 DUF1049 domain-containing protein [Brachybacterium sillae]
MSPTADRFDRREDERFDDRREDRYDDRREVQRDVRREERPAPRAEEVEVPARSGGKTAGIWLALILGAIVLVLLLIFVIQNNIPTVFTYFGAQFTLPLGVAILLAAIVGALVMALVGSVRMMQMAWQMRQLRRGLAELRERRR